MQNDEVFESFPVLNEKTIALINEQSGGDLEFLQMLFSSFFQDADELLQNIGNALQTQNNKLMHESVHSLKGLSGTIGASQMFEILKVIDTKFKTNQIENLQIYIELAKEKYLLFKELINKRYFNS